MSKDLPLKLFCILVAFILWLYVIGEENPQITYSYSNIPVQLNNEDTFDKSGLLLEGMSQDDVIVRVKGRRNDILKLDSSKIKATIDLGGINGPGSAALPVQVTGLPSNIELVSVSPQLISVSVDRLASRTFDVELVQGGTLKEGFVLQEYALNPSRVTVKGPEKLLNTVSKAVIDINVDELEKDVSGEFDVKLLDPSGKPVNGLTIEPERVFASLDVSFAKEVTVKLVTTGEPPEGYRLFKADVVPQSITIMGDRGTIETINEINTVPVDLTGINGRVSYNVQIELPQGATVKDNLSEVKVNLDIDQVAEKELNVNSISVVGQDPQKLDYNFESARVVLEGRASILESVTAEDVSLKATVPAEPGTYDAVITGSLDPAIKDVTIKTIEPPSISVQVLR